MRPVTSSRIVFATAGVLFGAAGPYAAFGQDADGGEGTLPSDETVRSVLMNNWTDSIAIHYARQLYDADLEEFGPYLAGLHYAGDWTVNQIDGATALFRAQALDGEAAAGPERPLQLCESNGTAAGDELPADTGVRHSYPSAMCFDDGGILNVEYLRETERQLPIQIEKSYAMVPERRFMVVRYTLTNNIPPENARRVRVRFAEVVDINNKAAFDHEEAEERLVETGRHQPSPSDTLHDVDARWHADLNAWIADMSASNGVFLVFGAFQDMDRHRAFRTVSDQLPFDRAIESEMNAFDRSEVPENVEDLTSWDLGLSLWKEAVLDPASRQQYSFFYAVTGTLEDAQGVAQEARAVSTPDEWFDQTAAAYGAWQQQGLQIAANDPGIVKAYTRALITSKHAQQPEFGSFVAATNPAYGFKVWPRDSSVTALGFAAAGHVDEAVKFYRWMAAVQEDGSKPDFAAGTWFSNYSYWIRKLPKRFVEPEWDSLGLFMIGVYHTWRLLQAQDPQAAQDFLTAPLERLDQGPTSIYDAVSRAAEYIESNINEHGFGPADHSIWEEDLQFATFTQATYASGLNAARLLAAATGDSAHAQEWNSGARRILDAIHRPASSQPCPGLWHDGESRWNRGVYPDCTRDDRLDASTDLLWVFGLVDPADTRADSQRQAVLSRLTPGEDDIGIGRYEGDQFYYENPFSPGGMFEASQPLPSWPQMDMYMAMLEHWRGIDDLAAQRLTWYAKVTNVGYMPPGEGVDWPTDRPLPSTSAEPVTAAWYQLGLLNQLNLFDPRLPPLDATTPTEPTPTEPLGR